MLRNLGASSSLVTSFLSELRDNQIQRDRERFRRNMTRLGNIFAYEISREMPSAAKTVNTPLGSSSASVPEKPPVIVTILRAGLPLQQGMLEFFEYADTGYVGAYRKPKTGTEFGFEIALDYLSCPSLEARTVIVADPMLATGSSAVLTLRALAARGNPQSLHFVSVIAANAGVELLQRNFPALTIWAAGVDERLNEKGYIVPGLGDAGDLAFGSSGSH